MKLNCLRNRFEEASLRLPEDIRLRKQFLMCAFNTLDTTVERMADGSVFVITGDIPALWLRDSSAQVRHYLLVAGKEEEVQEMIAGLIRLQMECINTDPYANAFNKGPTGAGHRADETDADSRVWERKYEVDSLCYPLDLAWQYWKRTGKTDIFDDSWLSAVKIVLDLFRVEQRHFEESTYRFARNNGVQSDTLRNKRMGMPVNYTGMTWSGFRPSDDACQFNYLIPSNMFAVVVLNKTAEIVESVISQPSLARNLRSLAAEIDYGIKTYGIVNHPIYGKMYAYETDGYGNHNLMDDANVPSLLSIPYLGYADATDPIYKNTRNFILGPENPHWRKGLRAKGVGSPHTPSGHVWPIGIIMEALTCTDREERESLLSMLRDCDGGTGLMHESFDPDNPETFTRPWFAWANSLFAELLVDLYGLGEA